jgi:hypothetical protein
MALSIDERTEVLRVIQMLTAVVVNHPEDINLSRSIGVLSNLLYPIGPIGSDGSGVK